MKLYLLLAAIISGFTYMGYELGVAKQKTVQAILVKKVTQQALKEQKAADEASQEKADEYYEAMRANDVRVALLLAEIDRTAITVCDNPYLPDIVGTWMRTAYCNQALHPTNDPTCLDEKTPPITLNRQVRYTIYSINEYNDCGLQVELWQNWANGLD